jgi:dienelactone hydrolase
MKFIFIGLVSLIFNCVCFASTQVGSINFHDKTEVMLNVEVIRAAKSGNDTPTVIWLHGCAGLIGNHKQSWVSDLNSWGYNVVVIDAFSTRGIKSVCKNTFVFPRLQFGYDAYYVAKWIKSQTWGHGKVAVIGYSFGAGAILEMANQHTLKQEFGDIIVSAGVVYYPWCGSMAATPGVIPIQFHLAGNDDITPPAKCVDLANYSWKDQAVIQYYNDAYHGFDIPGANFMLETQMGPRKISWSAQHNNTSRMKTKEFLDEQLKSN